LFHFAAEFAPEGDVGKFENRRIAAALDWGGAPAKLVSALIESRWLDPHPTARLVVHGWAEHADRATLQKLNRAGKKPIQSNHQDTVKVCDQVETSGFTLGSLPEPEPEPEPEPHTQPVPSCVRVMPKAADMNPNDPPSERFDEAWAMWPLKVEKDAAARAWVSVVTRSVEEAVFACIGRYLASDQVARGVVGKFAGWLFQQSRDGWAGEWPKAQSREGRRQAEIEAGWDWSKNGTSD
jgi:hypothetical protein